MIPNNFTVLPSDTQDIVVFVSTKYSGFLLNELCICIFSSCEKTSPEKHPIISPFMYDFLMGDNAISTKNQ